MEIIRGILPIKYPGIRLISSKLSVKDCNQIVEKMISKIRSWASKKLSYGGMLQLMKTVLLSIRNHQCRIFILPKRTTRKFENVIARFLWAGVNQNTHKAKVAWNEVRKPTSDGGLGVKNLYIWNKALVIKHIWNICGKKELLWIIWVRSVMLLRKSLWAIPIPLDCSWCWGSCFNKEILLDH